MKLKKSLKFDQDFFFNKNIGFTPFCDYKPHKEIVSGKIIDMMPIVKLPFKSDSTDRSVFDETIQPLLFNFNLAEPPHCKEFCETEQFSQKTSRFE